jgi:hypothetical protein
MKHEYRFLLIMSLCVFLFLTTAGPAFGQFEEETPIDIYLLIGQSNMAGRAPIEEKDALEDTRILLLNADDQWEQATHPLNQYSTIRKTLSMQRLNIGATFAQSMREANSSTTVGLVVNAKGGTAIELWEKDTTFYDEAVRRTKAAEAAGGTLRGILWHQGESNSESPDYLDKLEQLIADLREDLESPDLPFVAGQVSMVKGDRLVNRLLLQLPECVESTGCVSSEGMIVFDGAHFDPPSTRELGRRYATIMRELHEEAEEK